jgi:O-antigen biosynthesis protein WbqV
VDLAKDLIRLAGLRPGHDIEIAFTGTRPGEKLFEELAMSGEQMSTTRHPKIFIGKIQRLPQHSLRAAIARLERAVTRGDGDEIKRILNDAVPETNLSVLPLKGPAPAPARVAGGADRR